jgi:tetratricopeptide (TPR) repeat protein
MSVKVAKNRFIVPSLRTEFYQHVLSSVSNLQQLGKRLVQEAELAQSFRNTESLEELAKVLSNFPIRNYQTIGQYYLGWCGYRRGENTDSIFEKVLEQSSTYRGKSFLSLAALATRRNEHTEAIRFYREAMKWDKSPSVIVTACRTIAVLKSIHGSHKQALKELEYLAPIARYASPKVYFDYLNSLAVEVCEANRVEEAQNISRVVLASPYVFAYPEWRETGNEIDVRGYKSRSSVRVIQKIPGNLLYLPEPSPVSATPIKSGRGRLLNYADWKKKMGKDNGEETNIDEMSDKDIFMEIMHLSSQETITRKELQQILDAVKKITSKKA